MNHFFLNFIFLLLFVSCNNHIPTKNGIVISNVKNTPSKTVLNKTNKKYILKKQITIPKNHSLIIKNGVRIILKKNGKIINNGSLYIGEKNKIDSVFNYILKTNHIDTSLFFNVEFYSKTPSFINSFNTSSGSFFINSVFFKNIIINSKKTNIFINNSIFFNSELNNIDNDVQISDSFFQKSVIKNTNNSFILNNSVLYKLNNYIYNDSVKNSIINNCLLIDSKKGFYYNKSFNNNIINSIFINNKNAFYINKNNTGYIKFYNNLFIKNNIAINNLDSCQLYIINNTFYNNNTALKGLLNKKISNKIISKNNIYDNNTLNFDLNKLNISNSYCISNTDTLMGYYNIYSSPLYINIKKHNYNLKLNSPGIRSGINNTNLGVNINDINIIKYLKY